MTEVVLAAFGNDVAHSAESSVAAKYRSWKERRERHMIKAIDNILAGNAAKAIRALAPGSIRTSRIFESGMSS